MKKRSSNETYWFQGALFLIVLTTIFIGIGLYQNVFIHSRHVLFLNVKIPVLVAPTNAQVSKDSGSAAHALELSKNSLFFLFLKERVLVGTVGSLKFPKSNENVFEVSAKNWNESNLEPRILEFFKSKLSASNSTVAVSFSDEGTVKLQDYFGEVRKVKSLLEDSLNGLVDGSRWLPVNIVFVNLPWQG